MRTGKKIFWGIMFVLGAVALIVGSMGLLGEIGFWTILFSIALLGILVDGCLKRRWEQILFSIAFLGILHGKTMGIEALVPWTLLGAALLGTIGLYILFPGKGKHNWKNGIFISDWSKSDYKEIIGEDGGENIRCGSSFTTEIKYINSKQLKAMQIESSFGSLTVYLDNAVLMDKQAVINVDASFGMVELYIPRDWNVSLNVESAFGGIKEHGKCNPQGDVRLLVNGDVSFGSLEIHYI